MNVDENNETEPDWYQQLPCYGKILIWIVIFGGVIISVLYFVFWIFVIFDAAGKNFQIINRYRRGLKTCPQAKTSKSGRAIFFSFFRRVQATSMTQGRVENTRIHFWSFSPVSVN